MNDAISRRQTKEKIALIERFKRVPIIQAACEKENIGRATYYRWRREDHEFAEQADEALAVGASIVNDIAESQLISAIRNQNLTAIIFWLKSHHPAYANKVEVTGRLKHEYKLSTEEEELIAKALTMVTSNGVKKP